MHKLAGILALALGRIAVKLSAYADADASRASAHIRVTVKIADWPPSVADELVRKGIAPAVVARMFARSVGLPPQ